MTINEHQKGMLSMSNDILTKYTEEQNRNEGRRGYYAWKNKKETNMECFLKNIKREVIENEC